MRNWFLDNALYFMVAILLIAMALFAFFLVSEERKGNLCFNSGAFSCRDQQVQRCVKSERYSRDECIRLVRGGK